MDDTDKPDPVLQQVPLMRNPTFQPPKPITLNNDYRKLISNFTATVVPPKLHTSKEELESWQEELQHDLDSNQDEAIHDFTKWLKSEQTKIAPGYEKIGGVITPNKSTISVSYTPSSTSGSATKKPEADVNELDKVFGKTSI